MVRRPRLGELVEQAPPEKVRRQGFERGQARERSLSSSSSRCRGRVVAWRASGRRDVVVDGLGGSCGDKAAAWRFSSSLRLLVVAFALAGGVRVGATLCGGKRLVLVVREGR
jgi:hypothetical protein